MSRDAQGNEDNRNSGYVISIHKLLPVSRVQIDLTPMFYEVSLMVSPINFSVGEMVIMECNWLHMFNFSNRKWLRGLMFSIPYTRTRRFLTDFSGTHEVMLMFSFSCSNWFSLFRGTHIKGKSLSFGSCFSGEYPWRHNMAVGIQFWLRCCGMQHQEAVKALWAPSVSVQNGRHLWRGLQPMDHSQSEHRVEHLLFTASF